MMQPIPGGAAARPFKTHHNALDIDALPAHRAGAVPQAAGGRRARPRLRDQPQLPQRGDLAPGTTPSSRCWSSTRPTPTTGPDGPDRGDARRRAAADLARAGRAHATRATTIDLAPAVEAAADARGASSEALGGAGPTRPTRADSARQSARAVPARERPGPREHGATASCGRRCSSTLVEPHAGRSPPSSPTSPPSCRRSPAATTRRPRLADRFELYVAGGRSPTPSPSSTTRSTSAAASRQQVEARERGRRRGAWIRRGLRARAGARHAAHRGRGHRHRPAGDAASPTRRRSAT